MNQQRLAATADRAGSEKTGVCYSVVCDLSTEAASVAAQRLPQPSGCGNHQAITALHKRHSTASWRDLSTITSTGKKPKLPTSVNQRQATKAARTVQATRRNAREVFGNQVSAVSHLLTRYMTYPGKNIS